MRTLTLTCILFSALSLVLTTSVGAGEPKQITLKDALSMARGNPRAEIARVQVQEARTRVQEARGGWYPKIESTSFLAPSPEIRCFDQLCTQTTSEKDSLRPAGLFAGFEVRIVQPVFTFGKLSSASTAARHGVAMALARSDMVKNAQSSEVARAFYGVKLTRELIDMLRLGRADIDDAEAQIADKIDKGSPDVDLQDQYRLAALRSEVDARLAEATMANQTALAGLRALVGDQNVQVETSPMTILDTDLASSSSSYKRAASDKRPELVLARQTEMAAKALLDLEQSRFWPNLLLVGQATVARAQGVDYVPSSFANDPYNRNSGGVGLVLHWELDPAVQRARAERMRSKASQADILTRLTRDAIRFDVEQAFARATQAKARWNARREGVKSTKAWIASVLQAQAIGLAESRDLADAYLAHFTMQSSLLESVFDWNIAVIELERASGELKR